MPSSSKDSKSSSRHRERDKNSPEHSRHYEREGRKIKEEPRSPERSRSPESKKRRGDSRSEKERDTHSSSRHHSSHRNDRDSSRHHERQSSKWDEPRERRGRNEDHFRGDRMENNRKRIEERRKRDKSPEKREWGKPEVKEEEEPEVPKEKPNFGTSGKLTEDTNTFKGVVIKYNEPPEARKPKIRWRLYPFKGDEALKVMYIHRQSAYLLGRDRKIADIPIDHPSASKQHAALQYRAVKYEREDGSMGRTIKPYLIDLGSANGTFLNNNKIDPQRYVELQEKDCIKFGFSTREYVLLHENSLDNEGGELSSEEGEASPKN